MLDPRWNTFLVLCETMNYTRAAQRLCLTQPAVTHHIRYLEDHYGLQIDTDRYTVYYDVFASNLMPDITVLENEP